MQLFEPKSLIQRSSILFLLALLSACDVETKNNVPGVPESGNFIVVAANQHLGKSDIQVGVAFYKDSNPIDLRGGNVVKASTDNDSILLLDDGFYDGSYAATLPNQASFNEILFEFVFEPIEARSARWYPVDILNIETTPNALVGSSAQITLPPDVLNLNLNPTLFNNINESITVTWDAGSDMINIMSAVTCTNNEVTRTYGTIVSGINRADDGSETIPIDQFVFDSEISPLSVTLITTGNVALLQETLVQLNMTFPDEDFFSNLQTLNPAQSNCQIELFLFRERIVSGFDPADGNITGSRSDLGSFTYNP